MTAAVLPWIEAAFALAFLCSGYRLLRGPGLPDRILALDTLYTNTIALVGRSIPTRKIRSINDDLESDIMIRSVHDIKATDLGGQMTMFKAEVDIDGREITRSYLENIDIEKLLSVSLVYYNLQKW